MVRPLIVPNPKVTLIINGGGQGWTESHLYGAQVPLLDPGLYTDAVALAAARVQCLDGIQTRLVDVRISLDNVDHDSRHLDPADLPTPSNVKGYLTSGGPDVNSASWVFQTVQVSWPIILGTSQTSTNPIEYIAGMPASATQTGPLPSNSGGGPSPLSYLQKYGTYLTTSNKWGALARVWAGTSYVVAPAPVFTAGVAGASNTFKFTFAAPPAANIFPPGSYVRLKGAIYNTPQKRLRLNGTYTVAGYDGTTLTVNVPRVLVAPTWTAFGTLNPATAGVLLYQRATYRKLTHRKRGAPLYVARGRS